MARVLPARRGVVRLLAALGAASLGAGLLATAATAEPTIPSEDDVEAAQQDAEDAAGRVAALEAQLAQANADLEAAEIAAAVAAEDYNEAQVALEDAEAAADAADERAAAAADDAETARADLAAIAMTAYRDGGGAVSGVEVFLGASGLEDVLRRSSAYDRAGSAADEALQRMSAAQLVADTMAERAAEARDEAERAAQALEAAATEAQDAADAAVAQQAATQRTVEQATAELAELRHTSVELERERQEGLEAAQRERENNAERERVENETNPPPAQEPPAADPGPGGGGGGSQDPDPAPAPAPNPPPPPAPEPPPAPNPPPASGAGQVALSWALTQLGKPYVWGAAGPDSYDCSGLTMRAYQQAGVYLGRTTRQQWADTARISADQLQPGDLIFYSNNGSASGIYHVAIYAGNGMRVHAPAPGKTVELVPMWWTNVIGFGRA